MQQRIRVAMFWRSRCATRPSQYRPIPPVLVSLFLPLVHAPSKWQDDFATLEALEDVKNGELGAGDGGVKVWHTPTHGSRASNNSCLVGNVVRRAQDDRHLVAADAQDCPVGVVRWGVHHDAW
ncbi:hypothetical protein B0H19DRAFT_1270039 [Mycena capillaripes]|nr:hypothetical protein B0H19DRAFT_1270039 [Mycena capillaripes]